MGKARPVFSEIKESSTKRASAEDVRQSVKKDAGRLLARFVRKVQKQQGIPERHASIRVK